MQVLRQLKENPYKLIWRISMPLVILTEKKRRSLVERKLRRYWESSGWFSDVAWGTRRRSSKTLRYLMARTNIYFLGFYCWRNTERRINSILAGRELQGHIRLKFVPPTEIALAGENEGKSLFPVYFEKLFNTVREQFYNIKSDIVKWSYSAVSLLAHGPFNTQRK